MVDLLKYPDVDSLVRVAPLLEGRPVIVQPKLDGSNAAIRRVDGQLVYQSRRQILDPVADNKGMFRNFLTWAQKHAAEGNFEELSEKYVLYGEVLHNNGKVRYENQIPFVLFDVYDQEENLWLPSVPLFGSILNIPSVSDERSYPVGIWGADVTEETVRKLFDFGDRAPFGGKRGNEPFCEGFVVKTYATPDEKGIGPWGQMIVAGKIVHETYAETKAPKTALDKAADPLQTIAEMFVTPARFDKAWQRVLEDGGEPWKNPHKVIGSMNQDIRKEVESEIKDALLKAMWKPLGSRMSALTLAMTEQRIADQYSGSNDG